MVKEFPPFGNYVDPDIERALDWFLGIIGLSDWEHRKTQIESNLGDILKPHPSHESAQTHKAISISDDRIAWYLYLADMALHSAFKYEPIQGARVLPIFKRIGADLDLLMTVKGVEGRVKRMMTVEKRQPDSALFELLVALIWCRNGWEIVEFIEEAPPNKRPDLRALKRDDEWFIECKRLDKTSGYSDRERKKWLSMWVPFRDHLIERRISVVLDIVFHVELDELPVEFMLTELAGKLELIQPPCVILSNNYWDVKVRAVDYRAAREHLKEYSVKYPSDQLNELIGGYRDPNRGFTCAVKGKVVRVGGDLGCNYFLESLDFALAAYWSCDAERAIEKKARDIRRHLSQALDQLPESGKGVVHIGLETLDGVAVESERYNRILRTIFSFDLLSKDLRWVYCHLFQSYAPPDQCWVIDETVYNFGRTADGSGEPINKRSAIISDDDDDPGSEIGVHWLREPP